MYWLCVTRQENWEVIKKRRIWGVSERQRKSINQTKPDDILVFYVIPKKITGIYRVVSYPYEEQKALFPEGGMYPYRVKIEPLIILKEPKDFTPLISLLSITRGKKNWNAILQRVMIKMDENDFRIIQEYLRKDP